MTDTPTATKYFEYRDSSGTVHVVGDRADIPPPFRKRAREVNLASRPTQNEETTDSSSGGNLVVADPGVGLGGSASGSADGLPTSNAVAVGGGAVVLLLLVVFVAVRRPGLAMVLLLGCFLGVAIGATAELPALTDIMPNSRVPQLGTAGGLSQPFAPAPGAAAEPRRPQPDDSPQPDKVREAMEDIQRAAEQRNKLLKQLQDP